MTGDHLDDTPDELADITDVMDSVVEELTAKKAETKSDADDDDDGDGVELPPSLSAMLFIADEGKGKPHAGYQSRTRPNVRVHIRCAAGQEYPSRTSSRAASTRGIGATQ